MSTLKVNSIQNTSGANILGQVLQVVVVQQDTLIQTSAVGNYHSSLPTISQGVQVLSTSFTPLSSGSTLIFQYTDYSYTSSNGAQNNLRALFEGNTCIAAVAPRDHMNGETVNTTVIHMSKASGSTSARTYSVRVSAHNTYNIKVNGYPRYSGVPQTCLQITEISG